MRWTPLHADHAIERVVITITPAQPVTAKLLQSIERDTQPIAQERGLNGRIALQSVSVVLGPAPNQVMAPDPGGFIFQKQEGGTIAEEVRIQAQEISYGSTRYERWSKFKSSYTYLLGPALDRFTSFTDVISVKLEYFDEFRSEIGDRESPLEQLIKIDTKYVAPFVFEESGPLHSHVGRFLHANVNERRLINANLNIIETQPDPGASGSRFRAAKLHTLAQDIAVTPGLPAGGSLDGDLFERLDELHDALKGVLTHIITEEAASRISLNAPDLP